MRTFDRSVLASILVLGGVAAAPMIACSSSDGDTPGSSGGLDGEGGVITPGEGGTLPDGAVEPQKPCAKPGDCPSGVCNLVTKFCSAATCKDGAKNGSETDIDCGADCGKCDQGKGCKVSTDCTSAVCKDTGMGLKCQTPTTTDGVKNGLETGIDCGGTGNPACADGQGCKVRDDCTSGYCKANVCAPVKGDDGIKNGNETDIDCGGVGAKRCDDALACKIDADCKSDVCKGLACQAPSPTDGKKNGTETDVDCGGGGGNPGCAVGLTCLAATDCGSLGCNYLKKCSAGRSCTTHYGGDTCGLGGAGGDGAEAWEDCCSTAVVTPTAGNPGGVAPVRTGKYQVTAGRMRVFLESVGYNVRAFVQNKRDVEGTLPKVPGDDAHYVLEPTWDMYLPTSFEGNENADEIADRDQGSAVLQPGIYTSIRNHLGGRIFRDNQQASTGCFVGGGTHAFRFPQGMNDGTQPLLSQDLYDTKSMQCIDYLVAQAFCVWDGGRLETTQEWLGAWGAAAMPWAADTAKTPQAQGSGSFNGCRFPTIKDSNYPAFCPAMNPALKTIEYADYQYSYEYPNLDADSDYIVFISAPGRTRGRGPTGHADIIGTNYAHTSNMTFGLRNEPPGSAAAVYDGTPFTVSNGWNGSGSWEVHGYGKSQSRRTSLLNKYGKLGLRCAYP